MHSLLPFFLLSLFVSLSSIQTIMKEVIPEYSYKFNTYTHLGTYFPSLRLMPHYSLCKSRENQMLEDHHIWMALLFDAIRLFLTIFKGENACAARPLRTELSPRMRKAWVMPGAPRGFCNTICNTVLLPRLERVVQSLFHQERNKFMQTCCSVFSESYFESKQSHSRGVVWFTQPTFITLRKLPDHCWQYILNLIRKVPIKNHLLV